ncbi:MAG: L-threonylcarbamoyladenylate synthase [Pseudomonadota bacterium]
MTRAAKLIRSGGLVAMPTETVYGLAGDATNDNAVAQIFETKGRPKINPLIAHVADLSMAADHVHFSKKAERLAEQFWPGPLTLVLPRRAQSALSLLASAGLDTQGVRAPDHPIAQALIEKSGRPLAAPSANPSGGVSPTSAEHVRDSFRGKSIFMLEGGASRIGLESTIIGFDGDRPILLRPGGISRATLEDALGEKIRATTLEPEDGASALRAPGMMKSHYAPTARLRLNVTTPDPDEVFLAFGETPHHPYTECLSEASDLTEAAANLFAALRRADESVAKYGLSGIAAAPIPNEHLGEAINDRLSRAAAPK